MKGRQLKAVNIRKKTNFGLNFFKMVIVMCMLHVTCFKIKYANINTRDKCHNSGVDSLTRSWPTYLIITQQFAIKLKIAVTAATRVAVTHADPPRSLPVSRRTNSFSIVITGIKSFRHLKRPVFVVR